MRNDGNDVQKAEADASAHRYGYQTLAIAGMTLGLILVAAASDAMDTLQGWGSETILSIGLFASLGLSAFAIQQSWRLRRALQGRQAAEQASRRLARQDQLTGLANRRSFEEFGAALLADDAGRDRRALMMIDLDHFKPVNDLYGHAAGDKVLADYAVRLERQFPGGFVARFGGDEFAVISPPLAGDSEASGYARACIAAIAEPFRFNDAVLHLGASVGVALFGQHGDAIGDVMRRADIALYKAKHDGRSQVAFFEERLEAEIRERSWLEAELHKAVAMGDIVPFFQPIVDLATRATVGYEALARWRHAERGIINPMDFIPIAETCGLMTQVGEQILRKAAATAVAWPAHVKLAINLSPVQLREKTLGHKIIAILGETGLAPQRLEVEITEDALVADLETARETIDQLRAAGISVALDDFGTGSSTLQHLKSCKFDKLKIDRSFVGSMQQNEESRRIIDAILFLSRSFGIRCTAEGIEEQSELDALAGWGCSEGQGYFFGRPSEAVVPANDDYARQVA